MPFLDGFALEPLPKKWHAESVAWRETYFPEMPEVMDTSHWNRFYPEVPVPTVATIFAKPDAFAGFASKTVGATPATSDLSGRVWKAEDLDDNRFNTALKIIRAQASTELGSIQQHRMVYEKLDSGSLTGTDREIVEGIHATQPGGHTLESISFSKKRVCVEELRHHYQMAGVLTLDRGWDEPRWGRHWATETLEELFAMKPGEHVLDAFNIEFKTLLDTSTFLALIDRVGKYQLEMQHHFLYGPMALSMPYMRWLEESYHLAAGEKLLKAIAVAGVMDGGNYGIEEVQRTVNMWFPRGLEMFGSELGGEHLEPARGPHVHGLLDLLEAEVPAVHHARHRDRLQELLPRREVVRLLEPPHVRHAQGHRSIEEVVLHLELILADAVDQGEEYGGV